MIQETSLTVAELLQKVGKGEIGLETVVRVPATTNKSEREVTLELFERWDKEVLTPEEEEKDRRIYEDIERNGIPKMQI